MLQIGDFVNFPSTILGNKDSLFSPGLIIGTRAVQEDEEDPYNLRLKLVVCQLEDDHVKKEEVLLLDAVQMHKVGEEEQLRLMNIFNEDFKGQ